MNNRICVTILSILAIMLVAGCQSTSDEPVSLDADSYEYKGAADPLLSEPSSARAGALGDRFDLIQARQ
jgi:hypothetical protein